MEALLVLIRQRHRELMRNWLRFGYGYLRAVELAEETVSGIVRRTWLHFGRNFSGTWLHLS